MTAVAAGSKPVRVTSPDVAGVFQNVRDFQMLAHFMTPGGSTVSMLAQAHGLPVNAAYRKVKKLERLGLLCVLREARRAGRAVRVYGCPQRTFFIPRSLISLEEQMRETFAPYQELMRQQLARAAADPANPVAGLIFHADASGIWLLPADARGEKWNPNLPGTAAFFHGSGPLYLDYPQAKALERELTALFDRYRSCRGGGLYLMHMFMTPLVGVSNFAFPHAGYTDSVG